MSRYEFLLFVHVAAVIVWLGTGTALAFIAIYAERSRDRALGERLGTLAAWLGPRVFAPASLGTLVAGILLGLLARAELAVLYLAVADMLAKPTGADTGTLIGGAVILGLVALGPAVVFASTRAVRLR